MYACLLNTLCKYNGFVVELFYILADNTSSCPGHLAFGNRTNPTNSQVGSQGDDTNDPQRLSILLPIISEDDGEDDSAQIAEATNESGYNA